MSWCNKLQFVLLKKEEKTEHKSEPTSSTQRNQPKALEGTTPLCSSCACKKYGTADIEQLASHRNSGIMLVRNFDLYYLIHTHKELSAGIYCEACGKELVAPFCTSCGSQEDVSLIRWVELGVERRLCGECVQELLDIGVELEELRKC